MWTMFCQQQLLSLNPNLFLFSMNWEYLWEMLASCLWRLTYCAQVQSRQGPCKPLALSRQHASYLIWRERVWCEGGELPPGPSQSLASQLGLPIKASVGAEVLNSFPLKLLLRPSLLIPLAYGTADLLDQCTTAEKSCICSPTSAIQFNVRSYFSSSHMDAV